MASTKSWTLVNNLLTLTFVDGATTTSCQGTTDATNEEIPLYGAAATLANGRLELIELLKYAKDCWLIMKLGAATGTPCTYIIVKELIAGVDTALWVPMEHGSSIATVASTTYQRIYLGSLVGATDIKISKGDANFNASHYYGGVSTIKILARLDGKWTNASKSFTAIALNS